MESSEIKVWINPPRYWAATQGMSDEQKAQLLEQIEQLILDRDLSALRKFAFIELNPERRGPEPEEVLQFQTEQEPALQD